MTGSPVTAVVVLHGGRRLAWKIARGCFADGGLASRYYGGLPRSECQVEVRPFATFAAAEEWARGFERHELAQGWEP